MSKYTHTQLQSHTCRKSYIIQFFTQGDFVGSPEEMTEVPESTEHPAELFGIITSGNPLTSASMAQFSLPAKQKASRYKLGSLLEEIL